MEQRQPYFLVGLFVVLAVTALVMFVVWLAGNKNEDYNTYITYFTDSVNGLNEGAAVRYRGVDVGTVKDISIDPEDATRIRIVMRISEDAPVSEKTEATMKMQGITGLAFVELSGGNHQAPPLTAARGKVPVIPSKPSDISKIVSSVPEILDRFSRVTEQVMQLMDDENMQAISGTLKNLENFTGSFGDNAADLRATLLTARETLKDISAAASSFSELAGSSGDELEKTLAKSAATLQELNSLLEKNNAYAGDAFYEAYTLLNELKKTSRSVQRLSEELTTNPTNLLWPQQRSGVEIE